MPASYFLGTRLIGDTILNPRWADTEEARYNQALFCPRCGDIWGRIIHHPADEWHATIRNCPRHPTSDAAGSFIAPWRTTFEELPPEVLRYEAQLRLDRLKD